MGQGRPAGPDPGAGRAFQPGAPGARVFIAERRAAAMGPSWRTATAILVPLVLAYSATACESTPRSGSEATGPPVTVSTPPVIPAQASNPAAPVTPAIVWEHYTNSKWGYSLNYPKQWYSLDSNGAPDTDKSFSSQNVGAPLEMTAAGIWLTVRVTSRACASVPGRVDGQATLIVAGSPVTRTYGMLSPPAGEQAWVIDAAIPHSSRCIALHYLARTQAARDGSLAVADGMITSLSFS